MAKKSSYKKIISLMTGPVLIGIFLIAYQNCGGGTANSLNIGSDAKPLAIQFTPSAYSVAINGTVTLSPVITGGTAPYSIGWQTPSSALTCASNLYTCNVKYSAANTYLVAVTVTDAKSKSASAIATITVTSGGGGGGSVTFTANPGNPMTGDASGLAQTTLSWNAPGSSVVQICIGGPSGPQGQLMSNAGGGTTGSAATGLWVTNGMTFYLQNTATCSGSSAANTIATFTAQVTTSGGGGGACTPTIGGEITNVSMNSSCQIIITGWAWDSIAQQTTFVRLHSDDISSGVTNQCQFTVGQHGGADSKACKSDGSFGVPGFQCTVYGLQYDTASGHVDGEILRSATVVGSLSSKSFTVPFNCVVTEPPVQN